MYNSSKKKNKKYSDICILFKLDSKAQVLEPNQAKIFKVSAPDVISLNPCLQIYPSKHPPGPLPVPHAGTHS